MRSMRAAGLIVGMAWVVASGNQPSRPLVDLVPLAGLAGAGRVVNRHVEAFVEGERRALRVSDGSGSGLVWVRGARFSTGTITVDIRGRDVYQHSFPGIAFRGANDARYEVVYLRPFNFRAADPERRSHAIQYAAHPDSPWPVLRKERPGQFERGLLTDADPAAWNRLRVVVTDDRIAAFINDDPTPTLDVPRLGSNREGLVGLWVGDPAGGEFANLRVEPAASLPVERSLVTPEVFLSRSQGSEGITFNGEGTMFVGADNAVWTVRPNGDVTKIADVDRHLGQAGIGPRDVLAADFGPTNVFEHGANTDGVVWRFTPVGTKTAFARGIADPNAVVVQPDGSALVSDDGTDKIYRVSGGQTAVWSTAVRYPNGLALSPDGRVLYVAQIFSLLAPLHQDDRVWRFDLRQPSTTGLPRVLARTGEGGLDGIVTAASGRLYVADNGAGKIYRIEPETGESALVAEGMPGVASLVFGEGQFDVRSIYATSTRRGGGRVWRIRVGEPGAQPFR